MFYREVGLPRQVVHSEAEILKFIDKNIGYSNTYYTVYEFKELGDRLCKYSSAIVDRIFIDIDEGSPEEAYVQMVKLHELLMKDDIVHIINFSGGGFHVFISIEELKDNKKEYLRIYCNRLKAQGIKFDPQVVGDVARLCRFPNSYNYKRKRWCISVNSNMIYNFNEIMRLSTDGQQNIYEIFGKNILNLKKIISLKELNDLGQICDTKCPTYDINDILLNIDIEKYITLPPFIKRMIYKHQHKIDDNISWFDDRYHLILWCRENGVSFEDCCAFLKSILDEKEFSHAVREERQIQYIYQRKKGANALFFPNAKTLRAKGYYLDKDDEIAIEKLYIAEDW